MTSLRSVAARPDPSTASPVRMAAVVLSSLAVLLPSLFGGLAHAASYNIDFGPPGSAPPASYAAAGRAGAWNTVPVLGQGVRQNLNTVSGMFAGAKIYMLGGDLILDVDDPSMQGDHGLLMDDMLIGFNDPVDVCIWVEQLTPGPYVVLVYALTPNNAALTHRVRVDDGAPGPIYIGGSWPGQHLEGITYQGFTVQVTTGYIGLHSGLWAAEYESGINGIQLLDATSAVELGFTPESGLLQAWPNPASGPQTLHLVLPQASTSTSTLSLPPASVEIVDVQGRLVWRAPLPGGDASLVWDGRDALGRPTALGAYWARALDASGRLIGSSQALVRVR